MKYARYGWLLLLIMPLVALAQEKSVLDFTPHSGDLSRLYLYMLFGNIPGVLAGSGDEAASLIVGQIFGVFNSAVLAVGGLFIFYTFIMGTLMTAHEGEALGRKWSSIWTPLRSVLAIALMLPTKSGFCMIQVIVMWIVLQGIGAANSVWFSALDYLEKGGVFLQIGGLSGSSSGLAGSDFAENIIKGGSAAAEAYAGKQVSAINKTFGTNIQTSTAAQDALNALINVSSEAEQSRDELQKMEIAGELLKMAICMEGLRRNLLDGRRNAEDQAPDNVPPAVPNLAGVSTIEGMGPYTNNCYETNNGKELGCVPSSFVAHMPMNIGDAFYKKLVGACGVMNIASMSAQQDLAVSAFLKKKNKVSAVTSVKKQASTDDQTLTGGPPNITGNIRIRLQAVQAMMDYLAGPARRIVDNYWDKSPEERRSLGSCGTQCGGKDADPQWTSEDGSAPLLSGFELNQAVNIYYGIVRPALRDPGDLSAVADFIVSARRDGWIMAGAYFFQLAKLNDVIAKILSDNNTVKVTASTSFSTGVNLSQLRFTYFPGTSDPNTYTILFRDPPEGYINFQPFVELMGELSSPGFQAYLRDAKKISARKLGTSQPTAKDILPALDVRIPEAKHLGYCPGSSFFGWCPTEDIYDFLVDFFVNPLIVRPINLFLTFAMNTIFIFVPNFWRSMTAAMSALMNSSLHPILGISFLGRGFIDIAGNAVVTIIANFILATITPLFAFVVGYVAFLIPILFALLFALFMYGVTLAFWAPLIPFIVFLFGAESLGYRVCNTHQQYRTVR